MTNKEKGLNFKKYLLIFLGSISLALGFIGIIIPVLPTTPFLLLTALCYLRSSERLYNWLIGHKVLGPYLYTYLTYRAITLKTKIGALVFLWLTLLISIALINILPVRIFLLLVGAGVSTHLLTLKTLPPEDLQSVSEAAQVPIREQK